jgi:hypothetical protein
MVAGQQANQFRRDNINVLVNGFVTHCGQLVLLFEPPRDQFRGPAQWYFLMHILSDRFRFEPVALRALVETPLRYQLGPSWEILLPTPEIPSQFATDTGMTAP